jgi:protoporphyrin/coproporphyrin ferrochelatase
MKTAVLLLNFGEPESPVPGEVVPFLERIFTLNASLMGPAAPAEAAARSRRMAEERAPGLIEEYERIGGSPLARQARGQAEGLGAELRRRGHAATTGVAYQFTSPSIAEGVAAAREAGAEAVVGLPVYPLAGPTTTIAALVELREEMDRQGWDAPLHEIAGWHRHPGYLRLRADAVLRVLEAGGLSLDEPGTRLVFSAHGTPLKYLEEGSRYDLYVRDFCDALAAELRAPGFLLGYQNHANRPGVRWTQPEIAAVIAETDARRVVVDPVSFMHEQSETLAELDHELRGAAEERGIEFHRVPIPHDDPAFVAVLADVVEAALRGEGTGCRCRDSATTYCLNASLAG